MRCVCFTRGNSFRKRIKELTATRIPQRYINLQWNYKTMILQEYLMRVFRRELSYFGRSVCN